MLHVGFKNPENAVNSYAVVSSYLWHGICKKILGSFSSRKLVLYSVKLKLLNWTIFFIFSFREHYFDHSYVEVIILILYIK